MGERSTRYCDFCGKDVETGFGPMDLFGVEVHVRECVTAVWSDERNDVLSFKGELCGNCKARLTSALANAYHAVLNETTDQRTELPKATAKPKKAKRG